MKRIVLCLVFAASAMASESFTLNIPVRFNANQETGEVRVTLGLNAAPAGSQLVVNGMTLTLGATQSVAGDTVTFAAGAGNSVLITYRPISNFGGGDFCAGGGAVVKDIPMRFVGAQDVTEYRVTTYVVAAPDVDCTKPSKRTAEEPANLVLTGDGVAPALVATNRGRHPIDVVLVLDKSGSMSGLPPESVVSASKAEILRAAIVGFLDAWKEIDAPNGADEWSQDRIGVVAFDSTAAPQAIAGADGPANFFLQRGVEPIGATHQWNAINTTVVGLTPGGATTIGGGINAAMQQWVADPKNDLSLIIVTDGMQNTAPLVQPAPSGLLALPVVGTLPAELSKRFIPIRTIAFGVPAAVDDTLLRGIALQTSGVSYIAVNGSTMFDTFALTLVSILKGNTASLATRHRGTMSGSGPSAAQNVVIDRSARRAVFLLQWNPPLDRALDLEVFRPGSTTPATPTSSSKSAQASIHTFDLNTADAGTWSVRVKRADQTNTPVPYTLNVLLLEGELDYSVNFDNRPTGTGTGDAIRLRAKVTYAGKPLTKLPANAIRARVQRPNEGIGNILHNTRGDSGTGTSVTPNGDIQTAYDRKLAGLTDHNLLDRVMPRDAEMSALTEEGDGIYSATVANTSTPGLYAFEVVLDWDDPRTGRLHREERLERDVKVKPDAAQTAITTRHTGDGTVLVQVTPRDRFGNYVGPGYGSLVKARLNSGGTLASEMPVDRDQTGVYVFTVNELPMGVTPDLDITVDGVPIDGTPAPAATRRWRAFIDVGPESINGGIERPLSATWSIEGIVGYHWRDPGIYQLSIGGKRWFGTSPLRPFLAASYGLNHDTNGTHAGASVGAGVLYEFTPKWGIEGVYNYHFLFDSFATAQVGVRWEF